MRILLWACLHIFLLAHAVRAAGPGEACESPGVIIRKTLACRYAVEEAMNSAPLVGSRATPPLKGGLSAFATCTYSCAATRLQAVRASCEDAGLSSLGSRPSDCPVLQAPAKAGWLKIWRTEIDGDWETVCRAFARRECQDYYLDFVRPARRKSSVEGACCALPPKGPPPEPELPGPSSRYGDEDGEIRGILTPGVHHVRVKDSTRRPPSFRNFQHGWDFFTFHREHPPISRLTIDKIVAKPGGALKAGRSKIGTIRFLGAPLDVFENPPFSLTAVFASPKPRPDGLRTLYYLWADSVPRERGTTVFSPLAREKRLGYFQEALDELVIVPELAREGAQEESARAAALQALQESFKHCGGTRPATSSWATAFDFNSGEITGLVTDGVQGVDFADYTVESVRGARYNNPAAINFIVGPHFQGIRPLILGIDKCSLPSWPEAPLAPDPEGWIPLAQIRIMGMPVTVYTDSNPNSGGWHHRLFFYDPEMVSRRPFIYYDIGSMNSRGPHDVAIFALQEFFNAARFRLLPRTSPPFEPRRQTEFFGIPLSQPDPKETTR